MVEPVTTLDTYVNGIEVVSSDHDTITLSNGVTIEKKHCKYVSSDLHTGATYCHYKED